VILAALTQNRTSAGIALALESAQLLMTPETAAELERLRARVAELEAAAYGEQHEGIRLLSPVEQIRHLHGCVAAQMGRADTLDRLCREKRARVAELESERHSTNAALADVTVAQRAAETAAGVRGDEPAEEPIRYALTEKAAESADKLTALFTPTQVLREERHEPPLHHSYRVPRDLPETGGV
jgi:hypothetical protein